MGKTAIAWTEETWNPVTGCSKVSPGCAHCYAETLTNRYAGQPGWPVEFKPWTPENAAENVVLHPDRLDMPLRWRKPKMVFVNSMSDLFHELVPDDFIAQVFARMLLTPQHTYQVLTKRSERMREWCSDPLNMNWARNKAAGLTKTVWDRSELLQRYFRGPLPNVWLGVSAENQHWADVRLPDLLATDAAVRFVSAEPLLGPIDLHAYTGMPGLDWVIVGGESAGPADRALVEPCPPDSPASMTAAGIHKFTIAGEPTETAGRIHKPCAGTGWKPKPDALEWVRDIRDECNREGVALFFKQWGGATPKKAGRMLDGRTWDEFPTARASGG